MNQIQTTINNLHNNHHHIGTGDNAPKIDGSTEWFPTGPVDNNGQRLHNVAAAAANSDAVIRSQIHLIDDGVSAGYFRLVTDSGSDLLVQWRYNVALGTIPTGKTNLAFTISGLQSMSQVVFATAIHNSDGMFFYFQGPLLSTTTVNFGAYNATGGSLTGGYYALVIGYS